MLYFLTKSDHEPALSPALTPAALRSAAVLAIVCCAKSSKLFREALLAASSSTVLFPSSSLSAPRIASSSSPYMRQKSPQLLMKFGLLNPPLSAEPIDGAVLTPTPSIGLLPLSISSTNTPGARYSGMKILLVADSPSKEPAATYDITRWSQNQGFLL